MTETRQSSSQQNQSLRWIKTFVGVVLAALLLFVLFKELHSLSKGLEESRKSLEELSNRLAEEEDKNEKLRKELGRVKERMDNTLQVFSNMQKVSRDKRSKDAHNCSRKLERLKRLKHCAEKLYKDVHCAKVKNCRGKDLIHAYKLKFTREQGKAIQQGKLTLKLSWQKYLPWDTNIVYREQFNVSRDGVYNVYCHLRVGQSVKRVVIRNETSELFSALPSFNSNRADVVVQMSGLAEIPSYALLHVEVEFKDLNKLRNKPAEAFSALFPDHSDSEQSPSSFGMFLVS